MGHRWSYIPQTVDIRNGKRRCTTRGFANHDEKSDFQFPSLHVLIQHGRAIWFDRIYLSHPWCNVQFKIKIPTTITHTKKSLPWKWPAWKVSLLKRFFSTKHFGLSLLLISQNIWLCAVDDKTWSKIYLCPSFSLSKKQSGDGLLQD